MNCFVRLTGGIALLLGIGGGVACSKPDINVCDITARECQEQVYMHLLSLRGDGYDPFGGLPPMTVISESDYRSQLESQAAHDASNGPSVWDKALELLHFTTSGTSNNADGGAGSDAGSSAGSSSGSSSIDDQVAHTYAFYSPETKTVTIISHPSQAVNNGPEEAMVTLAHELVHSLQDKQIDLTRQDFRTSDDYFANDAMIEGDARFYENLFAKDVYRSSKDALTLPDTELDWDYNHFDQLGSSLFAARVLVYPLGAKYEAGEYRSGGNAAIRHGYSKQPTRTVGLLVGSDGIAPPTGSGDVCPPPYVKELSRTDLHTTGADQFGALLFYTFLRGWGVDHATAFSAAQSWTGDYLRVQASADYAATAVSWRIELSRTPATSIVQTLTAGGQLGAVADSSSLQINVSAGLDSPTWVDSPCQ